MEEVSGDKPVLDCGTYSQTMPWLADAGPSELTGLNAYVNAPDELVVVMTWFDGTVTVTVEEVVDGVGVDGVGVDGVGVDDCSSRWSDIGEGAPLATTFTTPSGLCAEC